MRKKLRHAMNPSGNHGCRKVMGTAGHVADDFSLLGIGDAGLEHADDRGGTIALNAPKVNGLANDGRVSPEGVRPETIGEDHDAASLGAVIFGADQAPEHGMQADHVEIGTVDHTDTDFARLAEPDYREGDAGEVAEFAESLDPRL